MSKTLYYSFTIVFILLFVVRKHPIRTGNIYWLTTKRKNVGACICLFDFVAYHSQAGKQTEKHPRWSIKTPVKCALRIPDPLSTLRRVYTTPRGSHPCIALVQHSIVVVSKYKNKASVTPFNM